MSETAVKMQEGDVFRWKWRNEKERGEYTHIYWCKSCIAVYEDGRLRDTYWHSKGEGHLSPEDVELTWLANAKTWSVIHPGEKDYFACADLVDTRHSNNSSAPVYLRPGAKRSAERMLAAIERKEADARSDIRFATRRLEECAENRAKIERGEVNDVCL